MEKNYDLNIENKVLGMLITDPKCIIFHISKLSHHLFYNKDNQFIFEIIYNRFTANKPIDLVMIGIELEKQNRKELDTHLINLTLSVSSSAHIEHYIMVLVEFSIKRDFINQFNNLIKIAKDYSSDIFNLRDQAFSTFENLFIDKFIEENKTHNSFPQLVELVEEKAKKIGNGELTGINSSLEIINKAIGGWQPSDLTILAARPGMGKTAFMVQQIVDVVKKGMSCAVFSLEMSAEQIAGRIINNYTSIPNYSILRKGMSPDEWNSFKYYKKSLFALKIHIDDTPGISINNLRLKAKMLKLRYNIDIIFIDYLQLMSADDRISNREQEISKISRSLKSIAKELNIPVIALSQLSRKVEERMDKRPLLSDLRDSGSIEQDADEVIFLYRPEYYGINSWGDEYENSDTENQIEIIIQKNRQGGLLSERYGVHLPTSKFFNL